MEKKTINLPDPEECQATLKKIFDDPQAQPDFVQDTPQREHSHADDGVAYSVRTAEYKGHDIEVKTMYEIRIDWNPFPGHVRVDDEGNLHCHSIPYATYGSAIDFVKSIIDIYPDSYDPCRIGGGGHDHE